MSAWKWMRGDYRVVGVQVEQEHFNMIYKIRFNNQVKIEYVHNLSI